METAHRAAFETAAPEAGVLFVASGPDYVDLAVQSARSLRAHEPGIAIDLVTDLPENLPAGLFDRVSACPDMHPREKLRAMPATRFARTLYVDCDTLFLAPLGDLFGLLDRFDCALAHDVRRDWELIRQGRDHVTPYAFPQHNSGVLLYRRSEAMLAFLAEWAARFFADDTISRDQVILKDLLWESDLRFYVLPPEFNLRRVTHLDAWEPLDAVPTILHSHRLQDHMRAGTERISTPGDLLRVERAALAEEWAGVLPEAARRWSALRRG
ncbi:putative nucleotide-diphospho-sugar transferase [Celeribacter indicus]|uniref:Uncharacterized protein n=1 Tax=Celeribacter indicus TaxID=1208324 RepID=A0A0B5DPE4_9RHOB|nr:putative nucleotide-diphospho-sugar transferase [Celeribacter indicus]AJE45463.1 hypothetical protein P73_0748 [Celeribacter indicus]SDX02631.1 hypothetical protein SAMN05443573_111131 [Celeribacter indicus]